MWIITTTLLLIIVGLWFRWRKKRFSTFEELGIPGPKPNIFLGNLGEMLKSTPIDCHNKWIKQYGKVVGYYLGANPTLIVADLDIAKQILIKDFHKFANRPQAFRSNPKPAKEEPFSAQLTTLKNKRWKEIRSIITPSFTTSKMKMMFQVMDNAVQTLMGVIENKSKSGRAFEIYDLYKRLTMDVIGLTAFGIQTDVQNNPDHIILKAAKVLLGSNFYSPFTVLALSFPEFGEFWKRLQRIRLVIKGQGKNPMTELSDQSKSIIRHRRESEKNRRNDLLQIMMDAQISEADLKSVTNEDLTAEDIAKEDRKKEPEVSNGTSKKMLRMSDFEIVDNSMLFFLAGYETTSTALAFATHLLVNYPDIQRKLRKEVQEVVQKEGKLDYNSLQQLKYLEQVMMEALRMYPPIYLFVNREASEDVQYGPFKIKKGMSIQIPVYSMNHDPDVWQNPEKFDPNRFSPENKGNHNAMAFQTFGVGPRNCVGMRFAQLEMKLALANILNKYEFVKAEETESEPITLKVSPAIISPAKGVILKAIPA